MTKATQRAVVVTGASTGIGRAIALALDANGFRVYAGVRKEADGAALSREARQGLTPLLLDVTDESAAQRAVETVAAQAQGQLYGLVNNAGVGLGGPLELVPIARTRELFEVNVIGLLAVTQAFLPLLRKARGRVVNIGSLAGILAMPGASSYAASKFAVQAITDSLRLELEPFGVHVTIVDPGAIESPLWEKGRAQKAAILEAAPRELMSLYAPLIEIGKRLGEQPRGIQPASCVAEQVLHALTSKKPKVRYLVGPGAKKAARLARVPDRLRDSLLRRFMSSGVSGRARSAETAERRSVAEEGPMKTLIYGAGPIGQWLALRLAKAGTDVTLLARNETYRSLAENGIQIVDGLTGERHAARVDLVEQLGPDDRYDLIVVAMQKASRLAVCPTLARNQHLKNVLFLGNDVSGFERYLDHLPAEAVLLGFPGTGGGWDGRDLVIMDREKRGGPHGQLYLGELDGEVRARTSEIEKLFAAADIEVSVERDMDGWLKYHYAFIAPTAGVIFQKGGDLRAVAADAECLHEYCRACREAGDVLRRVGYRRRQPPVFNLFYWLPRWLESPVFGKLFNSRSAQVRFGLHAPGVVPELLEMVEEFAELKAEAGMETPTLDSLLAGLPRPAAAHHEEKAS